jgi:hypothetical protein
MHTETNTHTHAHTLTNTHTHKHTHTQSHSHCMRAIEPMTKGPWGPGAVGRVDEGLVANGQGAQSLEPAGRGAEGLVAGANGLMDEGSRAGLLRANETRVET